MKLIYFLTLYLIQTCQSIIKPNVLLIIVDDLRPALGVYDDPNAYTPNIDKLAESSFVFTNAFAQQALCAPSRNSFLTSRRPDSLQLYDFYSYWRDAVGNFTTLPQHFKENGYLTHSIGKVFHPGISSNFSDDQPYSWSKKPYHPPTEKYKEAKVCLNRDGTRAKNLICPVRVKEQPGQNLPDIESLNEAVGFLDNYTSSDKTAPYFLAVGFHKPHIPLKFPRKYLKYHHLDEIDIPKNHNRPALLPDVAWNPWTDIRIRDDIAALNISFPFGPMPANYTKLIVQNYAAATTYIDDLIGCLLNRVHENTIVVLMGDHGVSMGEHGEFSKYSNFDIATRVPFILRVPNLSTKMIEVNELVELVDLFPTLVELTDVSRSLQTCNENSSNSILCTEGRSLVPYMRNLVLNNLITITQEIKTAVFTQYPRPGCFPTLRPNSDKPKLRQIKIMGYSIRTKEFRYTEWVAFDNIKCVPKWSKVHDRELYYHVIDPQENLNLASRPELGEIMNNLRKKLRAGWRYAI